MLDTTFAADGRRILDAGDSGGSEWITQMLLLPDGKLQAAGSVAPLAVREPLDPGRGGGHHLLVGEQPGSTVEQVD